MGPAPRGLLDAELQLLKAPGIRVCRSSRAPCLGRQSGGRLTPDEKEWDAVAEAAAELPLTACSSSSTRAPGMTAKQRKSVANTWQRRGETPPVAIVTVRLVDRGVITALNWFLRGTMKGFAPNAVEDALDHVQLHGEDARRQVMARTRRMCRALHCTGLLPVPQHASGST